MITDLALLCLVFLGALTQAGIGIGFSVVAGPLILLTLGAASAVPLLLLLNLVVSVLATPTALPDLKVRRLLPMIIGSVAGIAGGILVYPHLGEPAVLAITGTLLLVGTITGLIPVGGRGLSLLMPVSVVTGLATVWAATPGPLMAIGLILTGEKMAVIRRHVQPIALVSYGFALLSHGAGGWALILDEGRLGWLLAATILGSIAGLMIGPKLPGRLIGLGIRGMSVVAGIILLHRAIVGS